MPEEYRPLCQSILMIYLNKKKFTSVQVHYNDFYSPEEYTPLCKSILMLFSTKEYSLVHCCNNFKPKNIHRHTSSFHDFSSEIKNLSVIIHLCDFCTWIIYTFVRSHSFMIFSPEVYIPLCDYLTFWSKNIYLCASSLKWCFLHLKMFSTWTIYTTVQVFFNMFSMKNFNLCSSVVFLPKEYPSYEYFSISFIEEFPLCKLTKMVFSTLENVLYQKKTCPLCDFTKMVFLTLRKNIHLCASVLLRNIYLCASWLKWCLQFFSMKNITPVQVD